MPDSGRGEGLFGVVGSIGRGNTLTFLRRWSVGDEAAASYLLLGGPAG
jgi:hypothetical protein